MLPKPHIARSSRDKSSRFLNEELERLRPLCDKERERPGSTLVPGCEARRLAEHKFALARYNRSVVRRGRRPITREDAYAPRAATSLVPHASVVLGILAEHKVRVRAMTEASAEFVRTSVGFR